jgi:hypothetical protein
VSEFVLTPADSRAREYDLDGLRVRVLPLERVIASKKAARRAKDLALAARGTDGEPK